MRAWRRVATGGVLATVLVVLGLAGRPAGAGVALGPSILEPAGTGGLEVVDRALAKLSTHTRVLLIGAHPDDEDNSLLTWVSRGLGGEAAYLSMSRGEGGQNLIGPELGVELGAIRTGELMAARQVEGTRQYFTRAFDFGYTRSLDETFERWPREVLQRDAVRAARRFKPQLIVAIFPASERAGHGQHQASAVIAGDVFEMAGDPEVFPELGLPAWQPTTLFRRSWVRFGETTAIPFDLSAIDPLTGKSLRQISAESRSLHRSQDMGRTQPLGPGGGGLAWVAGGAGEETESPFQGIDTRLAGIAATLEVGALRAEVEALLNRVEEVARRTRETLSPTRLEAAVAPLVESAGLLQAAEEKVKDVAPAVADLLLEKRRVAEHALAAAAGVALDATVDREAVAPGDSVKVAVEFWPTGNTLVKMYRVGIRAAEGLEPVTESGVWSWTEGIHTIDLDARVGEQAPPTVPYFLRRSRGGDLYDWTGVDQGVAGDPLQPAPFVAWIRGEIAGHDLEMEREVVFRYGDQAVGEVRRPLRFVPALEVWVEPGLVLRPRGRGGPLTVDVGLRSNVERPVSGRLAVTVDGAALPVDARFAIEEPRGGAALSVDVPLGGELVPGAHEVRIVAESDDGGRFTTAYPTLEHPHVRSVAVPREAWLKLVVLDLSLPELGSVGYVRGASDRVPEILRTLGLPLELLSPQDLRAVELDRFDAIVIGSRAYETEPALAAANGRLLDYARGGGLVLVQYQQYQFARGEFAPYPLSISRPHGRVTDETSPVTVLEPEHPVFNRPNVLDETDWEGWVQERGLYFAGEWDERYAPLLELADAGRSPERGALLVAEVGDGLWVYTGLSFFRELPAGVPGAIRLFANLLALGGDDV